MLKCPCSNPSDRWQVDWSQRFAVFKCTTSNYFQFVKFQLTQSVAASESQIFNFFYTINLTYPPQRAAAPECSSFYFLELIVAPQPRLVVLTSRIPHVETVSTFFSNAYSLPHHGKLLDLFPRTTFSRSTVFAHVHVLLDPWTAFWLPCCQKRPTT